MRASARTFWSPEAALLLVSTKNRDLWPFPLAESNNGSPRFTDFLSLCACSESSLTNLIGSGVYCVYKSIQNLFNDQLLDQPECRWTWPEVAILGADQRGARPLGTRIAHFGKEWWPGNEVAPQAVMGLFGGTQIETNKIGGLVLTELEIAIRSRFHKNSFSLAIVA